MQKASLCQIRNFSYRKKNLPALSCGERLVEELLVRHNPGYGPAYSSSHEVAYSSSHEVA
jgi:hypothetical protein